MYTLLLLLVTIAWGSTFFIIKDTVASVNEYYIVWSRTGIAAIVMLVVLFVKKRRAFLDKTAILRGSILGILLAITYMSQTVGLIYTSTGHSAFITGAAVVAVPFILFLFFRHKITKFEIFSVIVVLIGLFLLTYDFKTELNPGDVITLITTFSYAVHIVLAGNFVKKTNAIAIVTFQFVVASLVSGTVYLFAKTEPVELTKNSISAILYLGFVGTLFCYFLTVWVQKYVSSIKVAVVFSLEPVFAAGFGYLFLNEVLNVKEFVGATIILLGVIVYQMLHYKKIRI